MKLSPDQLALLPGDEEVVFYHEHGYYKSKKIFTDEEIDAAIAGSERYYRGERDASLPQETRGWRPEDGYNVLRKNDYASLQNRELTTLIRKPLLGAIAARLCGLPVRLWHDQLLYKPPSNPEKAINVGWHTDRQYWKTCTSSNMLTAWIPFHDCDERMGTIMMIDGSPHWPDNTDKLNFFDSDLVGLERRFDTGGRPIVRVPINLLKGEVSFHSCLTIHGSGPNLSNMPRRAIAVHMQDEVNRYQVYLREDGTQARHGLDSFCRQIDGQPDYTDPRMCPALGPQ